MENKKFYNFNITDEEVEGRTFAKSEHWGHEEAYNEETEDASSKLTKADFDRIAQESDKIMNELVDHMDEGPRSRTTQRLIARHYENLKYYYEPTLALYKGLANLYVEDSRFAAYFSKFHRDLPKFMHDAMIAYCETHEART